MKIMRIDGVCWVLLGGLSGDSEILLERCPKKAEKLGVGEWFVPGGKVEGDETERQCLIREIGEEWGEHIEIIYARPLPIIEGSPVNVKHDGLFLMRPFLVTIRGEPPKRSNDGVELRWFDVADALASPVAQVRMMVAAAMQIFL